MTALEWFFITLSAVIVLGIVALGIYQITNKPSM